MTGCFAFLTFRLNLNFCLWVITNRAANGGGGLVVHVQKKPQSIYKNKLGLGVMATPLIPALGDRAQQLSVILSPSCLCSNKVCLKIRGWSQSLVTIEARQWWLPPLIKALGRYTPLIPALRKWRQEYKEGGDRSSPPSFIQFEDLVV